MRRLLQLGFLLLMVGTLVAPLAECLDSWDTAGLGNDTEFALFVFILLLCLTLVVAMLVARQALAMRSLTHGVWSGLAFYLVAVLPALPSAVPPHSSPPLRI